MSEVNSQSEPDKPPNEGHTRELDRSMRLRGAVLWLVVMSALFAAGCAVGVFFGWRYALYVSSRPSTPLQSRALRLAQINVVEKGMLAIGFVLLGRALWRYGSALKRARVGPSSAD